MKRRFWSWVVSVLVAAALAGAGRAGAASPPPHQRPVVVRVSDGGFHWGDAAIGAAGAIGLVLIVTALRLAWGTAGLRAENNAGSRLRAGRRLS